MSYTNIPGEEVERRSLATIDKEAGDHGFSKLEWPIVKRMIHASADFSIMKLLTFSGDPVQSGIDALKAGVPIVTDSSMMKSGISKFRLQKVNPLYEKGNVFCKIADEDVAAMAKTMHLPRSIFNMRILKDKIDGGIVGIGNAPSALWEVCRLMKEENVKPALILAMPVGFVNVIESKAMIEEYDVPYILMQGRRGGTTFAVSAINALSILAGN
ncbi:CbiC2: cobalt-precorrin-8X methylmutase [Desulfosarcina variabilis str. Montpellier]|uniref:precorrin-8X methylmutase n=1 Tax=Desulfosarcina variabilis TaxID=2300 RepID=UPI003AFB4A6C